MTAEILFKRKSFMQSALNEWLAEHQDAEVKQVVNLTAQDDETDNLLRLLILYN